MQNSDPNSEFVRALLQDDMHFPTQSIPESSYKTPDLRVTMLEGDMLVEVTSKEDDEQLRRLLKSSKGTPLSYTSSAIESNLHGKWTKIHEFPYGFPIVLAKFTLLRNYTFHHNEF